MLEVYVAFRGVTVPRGSHVVEFKFIPVSFYAGCLVTLGALAAAFVVSRRRGSGPTAELPR
jgi:uncharacterized membrane protein YfhO